MKISARTQLGLRFVDKEIKIAFLELMKDFFEKELGITEKSLTALADAANKLESIKSTALAVPDDNFGEEEYNRYMDLVEAARVEIPQFKHYTEVRNKVLSSVIDHSNTILINDEGTKYYYICDSVYRAAELVRVGENFTGRILKDVKDGHYTYLMGRHRMVRFIVAKKAIYGFYFDEEKKIAFEFGAEMEEGGYYFTHEKQREFTTIMQVLTFIELGDIQVKYLEGGKNNGGKKNVDKITNDSVKNVYIVDSNWNTLVIRTDGFAVRGHFRLQACGEGLKDRKLIWIDAFEKHGYKRKPTGEIVK